MATLSQLAVSNLALKGAGTDYNYINRFFATKAEADAALADSSWVPEAGKLNGCLTGDQGFLVYNAGTTSLDLADAATRAYIDTQIGNLVDSSPATLDTLNELAAAINDDPAYFTTAEAARVANTNLINAETSRATAAEAAVQADVDQNEADADAAIAAVQADVDQNETDADAAIAAENAAMLAAVAVVQADVDQNETDADAAIAAVQADVDQNESDADSAIAAVQADVDQNESDADAAIAAENAAMLAAVAVVQADVDQNETDADAAIAAVQTDVNQNEAAALAGRNAIQADVDANEAASIASLALKAPLASPALTGTPTSPTASQGAGTTQIATTAYVDTAVANLIDSSPGALDTLNELAAAIGDDANFSTTITNSIAAVQADVNQNEVDADAAIAAVQADVDANEVTAAGLVTAENTAMLAAVAVVQADVDQNETDGDAADAALGVRIDSVETEIDTARTNLYTSLGRAEGATNLGTFTGSTLSDNTTVRALLQELETGVEDRLPLGGGTLIGSLVVRRDFPDFQLRSNQEKRFIFTDDGGAATGAIKNVSSSMTFFAGGVGGGNLEMTVASDGVDVSALKIAGTAVTATAAELNYVDGVTSNVQTQLDAIQADVDGNESDADTALNLKAPLSSPALTGTPTAPTAGAGTNTTQLATTAFVETAVSNLVDGAPGALNTLNELAAALNDDTSAATNLTTLINANETHIDNLVTLSGVAKDANDFGSFTGGTIADNQNVKQALQALETKVEAVQTDVDGNESDADTAIAANETHIDNLATLSGVAKDAVNLGTFTGSTISDSRTGKQALQELETAVETKLASSAVSTFGGTLVDDADAAAARTTLGLGTVATTAATAYATAAQGTTADAALPASGAQAALHVDHIITLSGVAQASDNLGTFTGSTISDNGTIKAGMQELETAVESAQSESTSAGQVKTQVAANSADYFVTFVDSNNVSATAEAVRTGANLKFNPSTKVLDISSGTVHAQYLTLDSVNLNATATELNVLDGITATTAELNYTDGVTSNIQTQLDAKLASETITLTAFQAVVAASSDFADFKSRVAAL